MGKMRKKIDTVDLNINKDKINDVLIDLLIELTAKVEMLTKYIVIDFAEKNGYEMSELLKRYDDSYVKEQYEIIAYIVNKHGS